MEKNCSAGQVTYDNITWGMRFACWNTKPTEPHSEYVILIAFPRQQWLRESVHLYVHSLLSCVFLFSFTSSHLLYLR